MPALVWGMDQLVQHAFRLGRGAADARLDDEAAMAEALRSPEAAWVHLRVTEDGAARWLAEHLDYLDHSISDALLAQATRPRVRGSDGGALVILRGVNPNPEQEPDDMVSVRLWLDPARIVSVSVRDLEAVSDMAERFETGVGPTRVGDFLCQMVDLIGVEIDEALVRLDDETSALEEVDLEDDNLSVRSRITSARRTAVAFRRHIAAQRDALTALRISDLDWLEQKDRNRLGEAADRTTRMVETLDEIRERLHVIKDDLGSMQAERLNRNLYVLSIISVVFLPLGVVAGVFGVNLGGIPGAVWGGAFWVFCAILFGMVALQLVLLRLLRLI